MLLKKVRFSFALARFRASKHKKISVGSGGISPNSSWLPTDIDTLDLTSDNHWNKLLPSSSKVERILAEHVWEHLTDKDTELANLNCFKYLQSGGTLRIAVPDGFHPDKEYIEYVRPGGTGMGADDHKILYNYKIMTERLQKAGFKVNLLEYWDENGKFHYVDWTDEAGRIERSRRYDERNANGQLKYTSLIVDAIKP